MTDESILNNLQDFYDTTISLSDYDRSNIHLFFDNFKHFIKKVNNANLLAGYHKAMNHLNMNNNGVTTQPLNSGALHDLINLTAYYFRKF